MPRRIYKPEEITAKLRQVEVLTALSNQTGLSRPVWSSLAR